MTSQPVDATVLLFDDVGKKSKLDLDAVSHIKLSRGLMCAHISMRGDVRGRVGEWLGEVGSRLAIEGIIFEDAGIHLGESTPSVECQLVYSNDLKTPWVAAGFPCGSASLGLACRGMRFRLSAEAMLSFDCCYDIAFTDGTQRRDVNGSNFVLSSSGAAVEAVRLRLTERDEQGRFTINNSLDNVAETDDEWRLRASTVKLRLQSPAFSTTEPDILNAAAIPKEAWRAMAVSFHRRHFENRIVTMRLVKNAIVVGEGVVFDHDLNIVPGTDRLIAGHQVEAYRKQAHETRSKRCARYIAGTSVLCKTRAPENFGHFLVDMFPKAWLANELFRSVKLTYILQETAIVEVAREALTRIGINPFAISTVGSEPVLCESIVCIDGLTNHGVYRSPICIQALDELAKPITAGPYPKLYVRRETTARGLLNQDAVENIMRERGFAVIDPATLSLEKQIALFKGATTVVGPLGAALTNIVFCPPGSKIVALTAQSFPDTFFWFLSQHRKHEYREVRGLDASGVPDGARSWVRGFTLTEEDLSFIATL